MAAAAGKAIGLPAAAAPAVWLSQLGPAAGADRMLWQMVSWVQPRERGITHGGMMSEFGTRCQQRPPAEGAARWWAPASDLIHAACGR
jgi:hypothetical protein